MLHASDNSPEPHYATTACRLTPDGQFYSLFPDAQGEAKAFPRCQPMIPSPQSCTRHGPGICAKLETLQGLMLGDRQDHWFHDPSPSSSAKASTALLLCPVLWLPRPPTLPSCFNPSSATAIMPRRAAMALTARRRDSVASAGISQSSRLPLCVCSKVLPDVQWQAVESTTLPCWLFEFAETESQAAVCSRLDLTVMGALPFLPCP